MLRKSNSGEGHGTFVVVLALLLLVFIFMGYITYELNGKNTRQTEAHPGVTQY